MPSGSGQQALQHQLDHEKAQEVMGRYVEIEQTSGGAETMYPDVAAHLGTCSVCRALHDDLAVSPAAPDSDRPALNSVAIEALAGSSQRSPITQTPLDMLSREEIILRVGHVLAAPGQSAVDLEIPAAGYLLFYDTLRVGKLDLVVMFTLHHGDRPGLYRIEGVISPEQPAVRYKAVLWHSARPLEARVEGSDLVFEDVPLGPETGQVVVTLAVHARWRAGH